MQFGSDLEFLLKHLFRAFREDVPANLLCAESISVLSQAHVVQQFDDLVRVEETITSSKLCTTVVQSTNHSLGDTSTSHTRCTGIHWRLVNTQSVQYNIAKISILFRCNIPACSGVISRCNIPAY